MFSNIYAQDVAATHARLHETAHRLAALAEYWGDRPLSAVNGKTCREYVEHAGTPAAARRHLEDFRAAIIHHRREGFCSEVIEVVLPEKSPPRERWLTRSEAARLLWACWRGGQGRRKHVARFILIALFTGTRASAICGAAMEPTQNRGHVDLDQGVFYRRAPGSKQTNKRQPPVRLPP
jgi:integrase